MKWINSHYDSFKTNFLQNSILELQFTNLIYLLLLKLMKIFQVSFSLYSVKMFNFDFCLSCEKLLAYRMKLWGSASIYTGWCANTLLISSFFTTRWWSGYTYIHFCFHPSTKLFHLRREWSMRGSWVENNFYTFLGNSHYWASIQAAAVIYCFQISFHPFWQLGKLMR